MTAKIEKGIEIKPLEVETIEFWLVGDTSLIMHKWSTKAKEEMLSKQMKQKTSAKEAKDPEQQFRDAIYYYPGGGYGFPADAFKACIVNSQVKSAKAIDKTHARAAFHVMGEADDDSRQLVRIYGEPVKRQDMVRIQQTTDIRFRPEFKKWSAKLIVRFRKDAISEFQLINLYQTAGFSTGLGEWRPEKNGQHGMFHVAGPDEVTALNAAHS